MGLLTQLNRSCEWRGKFIYTMYASISSIVSSDKNSEQTIVNDDVNYCT